MFSLLTWNVNGLLTVIKRHNCCTLVEFLRLCESWASLGAPEVTLLCCNFQEVKLRHKELNRELLVPQNYDAFYSLARQVSGVPFNRFSGVSVFTRKEYGTQDTKKFLEAPSDVRDGILWALELVQESCNADFPSEEIDSLRPSAKIFDQEGRCLTLVFTEFAVINVYGIAHRSEERVAVKRQVHKGLEMLLWVVKFHWKRKIILVGDLNITATELDTCDPEAWIQRQLEIPDGVLSNAQWFA
eukprot:Gregarina_sp_Poly_1__4890@NODE_259_length_10475_cov_62_198501_g226_i0_p4_GENE_NODE_259_length_10475_cov_62_198501_g226_i0NODE_259_length_10475_cov_62_198501_g226_i0_p4_ORF_typecomplete_len243_score22_16Exo_endo_phos/PF03372_23/9_5e09_NODE_259_length_10475_cov_62_198501_g226_i07611489